MWSFITDEVERSLIDKYVTAASAAYWRGTRILNTGWVHWLPR
jgi:hypothetical protein